jgi:hypothetical protein
MREYIRQYITRAFNDENSGSCPDTHAVALWLARPQLDTLRSLDRPFTSARLSVAEARYLQKALVSVSSKLLAGASRMWQNRCKQFTTPVSSYATMTTLIGVYSGRDNISLSLSFDTAQKLSQASDYVLAYQPGGYVVDGQNGRNISAPARCNDNFDMFNCYFGWNPIAHRMELFTKSPLREGLYKALVNYNEPEKSSVYWTLERLSLLPLDSRERCIAYYRTQLP